MSTANLQAIEDFKADVIACQKCPRLREYCLDVAQKKKKQFIDDDYWGLPVPSFGDPNARILVMGLAPAAHGSNRTGRPFTGDGTDGMGTSDFLARSLWRMSLANQPTARQRDDGLELTDVWYSAIVRCAPPANKPTREETEFCGEYLPRELALLKNVKVIVALGKLSFDQMLRTYGAMGIAIPRPRPKFGHGALIELDGAIPLLGTYHASRQNTQTGRLSEPMLDAIFEKALEIAAR